MTDSPVARRDPLRDIFRPLDDPAFPIIVDDPPSPADRIRDSIDKQVRDLVLLLEWLDATEVRCWRIDSGTHEDVARRWLRAKQMGELTPPRQRAKA